MQIGGEKPVAEAGGPCGTDEDDYWFSRRASERGTCGIGEGRDFAAAAKLAVCCGTLAGGPVP